ncbi:Ca2+-dependent phosphoinositide-specific phospholipase C [Flavobacterium humidisoli]|uniref:Ca2+-dependent phosphoinositide-specific phospholipase C n=1 Tax=Flavobacterium humidisoli TaxID=2937442 RepID=A0ABY4LYC0_9FLAO|nr:Ca2+-dependent phosphoinositide-specific phospholipase C [Flavobacterium humidisoli]UPZ17812.1 Ca2+-dependent phosphoinositide-specific phospholipase C [Flavobacterium humidisoli]
MKRLSINLFFFIFTYSQQTPYNKNYEIACHNCYLPIYKSISDVLKYTSAIEIDVWDNFQGFGDLLKTGNKMNQDWYVKHDFYQKGNVNCFGGSFRECLNSLKKWSDEHKNHHVLTIFIDKKENWSDSAETRKPNDLDLILISIMGKENILTPLKLLKGEKNLKDAVLSNSLPSLDSLKGKFIFVITNSTEITKRNPLDEYLSAQKNEAICFVAPEINSENEIQTPFKNSPENCKNVIFYNMNYKNKILSSNINSINCISRIYDVPEEKIVTMN